MKRSFDNLGRAGSGDSPRHFGMVRARMRVLICGIFCVLLSVATMAGATSNSGTSNSGAVDAGKRETARLSSQLKSLVEMNSGTSNSAGVSRVQAWIASELKALGFEVRIDAGHLLIAERLELGATLITLIVHADTVFELTSTFQHFSSDENSDIAHGPGVIDDKGGIVIAIEGLRRYLHSDRKGLSFRLISSPSEEGGSTGLSAELLLKARGSAMILGFEPALEDGSVIEARRGNRWFYLKTEGREAHAGRDFKSGANACLALAQIVSEISRLTDLKRELTVSVGHFIGGQDKFNVVCGMAEAKIDTRFSNVKDRDRLEAKIEAIVKRCDVEGTQTSFEISDDSAPYTSDRRSRTLIDQYLAGLMKLEGREVNSEKSGGSADTNLLSQLGVPILDGLGAVGGKMHSENEFILISSLGTRSEALARFLRDLRIP